MAKAAFVTSAMRASLFDKSLAARSALCAEDGAEFLFPASRVPIRVQTETFSLADVNKRFYGVGPEL